MKSYYDHGGITILHGDCRELLPVCGAYGVVVADPPYGIAYESGRAGSLDRSIKGDDDTALRDWMFASVGDVPTACFATWRCIPPKRPRGCLAWERNINGMGDLSFPWGNNFELVWIFGEGWRGKRTSAVLRSSTIVTWNTGKARRLHPHEKPVDLIAQLVAKAPPGTVLDPFMGSGPVARACKDAGRQYVGIEIEERYCEIAAKRLAQEVLF